MTPLEGAFECPGRWVHGKGVDISRAGGRAEGDVAVTGGAGRGGAGAAQVPRAGSGGE